MCKRVKKEIISIFSGIDILGLGFKDDFDVVLAVEKEKMACETLKINKTKYHPNMKIINSDILEIQNDVIEKYKGVAGIIGGAPCQPFSNAKNSFDPLDERINCLFEYLRWVKIIKPEFFVLENTDALTQEKKRYILDNFLNIADALGYDVKYKVLNAHNYGNVQKRNRVIVVGVRRDIDNEYIFPEPTTEKKYVKDIIIPGEEVGECAKYDSKREYIASFVPQGGNWRNLPTEELIEQALQGNYAPEKRKGGMTGVYRRLSMADGYICPTLVTSPVQRNTMAIHPLENRPLSIKEYKRAQGIPDDYEILGSIANKYKFIGNAVPFELAKAISSSIYTSLYSKNIESIKIEVDEETEIIQYNIETIEKEIKANAYQLGFVI